MSKDSKEFLQEEFDNLGRTARQIDALEEKLMALREEKERKEREAEAAADAPEDDEEEDAGTSVAEKDDDD